METIIEKLKSLKQTQKESRDVWNIHREFIADILMDRLFLDKERPSRSVDSLFSYDRGLNYFRINVHLDKVFSISYEFESETNTISAVLRKGYVNDIISTTRLNSVTKEEIEKVNSNLLAIIYNINDK